MSILSRYLKKLGVSSPLDLTVEERETYNAWSSALSGRQLTSADVADFLNKELDDSVGKLTGNINLSEREDIFLKMKVDFIRKVKFFLATPDMERKMIEQQINSQL